MVTIAAVANDVEMLRIALTGGGSAKNITSPYDGTALIAAAHLGHAAVVRLLIDAGAALDHVHNLGWTALIEAVILGDGGKNHRIACGRWWRRAPTSISPTGRVSRRSPTPGAAAMAKSSRFSRLPAPNSA